MPIFVSMKRTDPEHKQKMYRLLAQWEKSGMNQKEFCQANDLSYSILKYWNRKRKEESESKDVQNNKHCQKSPSKMRRNSFIPITFTPKLKIAGLHITYPNGVQVMCPAEIELEQFKLIIQIY